MYYIACSVAMVLVIGWPAEAFQDPPDLLNRFLAGMKSELAQLPDYVCTQTVERLNRDSPEQAWKRTDTLRFDVALIGDRELYGPPGGRQFHDRSLEQVVGRGTVSTGRLGLMAKHVFDGSAPAFTYKGQSERDGRRAHEYDFDVAPERSNYRLRSGNAEELVGFQGTFWFDADSFDLIELELQAYDMPQTLGIAEATSKLSYSRVDVDGPHVLMPVKGSVLILAVDGLESLNRMKITDCRRYRAESTLRFENSLVERANRSVAHEASLASPLRSGTLLELALEVPLDLASTSVGDVVQARVVKAIRDGESVIVPQGSGLTGHIVRLEKEMLPFPMYQVGLAFGSLAIHGETVEVTVTMEDAGPHPALVRQAKRLDPKFSTRRSARMDILVREVQPGQGFLHWDARRGAIPRGFRMRWRVIPEKR